MDHRVLIASTPAAAWPRDWTIYVYPLETAEAALRAASFLVDVCLLIALVTLIITLILVIATALPRDRGEWERELRHAAVGPSILRDAALHRRERAFFQVNRAGPIVTLATIHPARRMADQPALKPA